jgi:hypothetical protein
MADKYNYGDGLNSVEDDSYWHCALCEKAIRNDESDFCSKRCELAFILNEYLCGWEDFDCA